MCMSAHPVWLWNRSADVRLRSRRAGRRFLGLGRRWRLREKGSGGGRLPRASGNEARQALEDEAEAPLIGSACRQVDLDLGLQFDDAGGDLDQAQPQRVELHDAPGGAPRHGLAQRPQQPDAPACRNSRNWLASA